MSWHFRSLKDEVLKIELSVRVTYWLAGMISAILRLSEWLSGVAGFLTTQSLVSRVPPFKIWEMTGRPWGSQGAERISGESGGVMVLWAASGSTRGKVVLVLASRCNSVWQRSLLTHLAQQSVATNHRTHLASWAPIFSAWSPYANAARLAQSIFLLMSADIFVIFIPSLVIESTSNFPFSINHLYITLL